MSVKHERIQGRPTNLRPMPLSVVRQLKVGDLAYLWWAKDGNPRDVQVDEVCEVEGITPMSYPPRYGIYLSIAGGDIDLWDQECQERANENCVEWGGRGLVYFYYPPETV